MHISPKVIKSLLKFIVPLTVSVGLCWIVFKDDSLSEMLLTATSKCDFRWMWLMLFIEFFSFVFRALRWGIQLDGVGIRTPFSELLYSIFGTYAVNLVIPRLGEVWRCGYIAHRRQAPFGTVGGTVIADRFADLIMGLLLTLATMIVALPQIKAFILKYPEGYERIVGIATSPWVWGAIALLLVAVVLFFRVKSRNTIFNRVRDFAIQLWQGFAAVASMPHKGRWLLWTIMLWGCYFFQLVAAFQAFPFTREIFHEYGYVAVLVCFTFSSIAMGVPSNGGIGPYQIAMIFGLSLYMPAGLDADATKVFEIDSKTFANLVLSLSTLLTIVVGLWTFASIALSRRRYRQTR